MKYGKYANGNVEVSRFIYKETIRQIEAYKEKLGRELFQMEKIAINTRVGMNLIKNPPKELRNNWRRLHHLPMLRQCIK